MSTPVTNKKSWITDKKNTGDFSSQEGEGEILKISSRGKEELGVSDKLMGRYPWVDKSLIEDILDGLNNNIDEAASLLKLMELSSEGNVEHENLARTVDEKYTLLNCGAGTSEKSDHDSHQHKVYTDEQDEDSYEMLLLQFAESFSSHEGEGEIIKISSSGKEELGVSDKLKGRYPWADKSLIENILVDVDNNIDEAASVLKVMELSSENFGHENVARTVDEKYTLLSCGAGTLEKTDHYSHQHNVYTDKQDEDSSTNVDFINEMLLLQCAESFSSQEGGGEILQISSSGKEELGVSDNLKCRYPWADKSMIKNILVGVDNNIDEAASLLKVMELLSEGNVGHENVVRTVDENYTLLNDGVGTLEKADDDRHQNKVYIDKQVEDSFLDVDFINEMLLNCAESSSHQNKVYTDKQDEDSLINADFINEMLLLDCAESSTDKQDEDSFINVDFNNAMLLLDGAESAKMNKDEMSVRFDAIPVESKFEDDDVYLVHRRDALKVMRSASHHSKAARDAYLRKDHFLARHHSLKAREERKAAERLNAEAAKWILSTTNSKNDMWTLDLHGLHCAEAVEALQEHLLKIEFQTSFNQPSSSTRSYSIHCDPMSLLLDSVNFNEGLKSREVSSSLQKSATLRVITGKGNHSRGQAILPTAIRSFLTANGYNFDDAKPGVIDVQPKFRQG